MEENTKVIHNYAQALFDLSKNPIIISQLEVVSQMFEKYHNIAAMCGKSTIDTDEREAWVKNNLQDFFPEVRRFVQLLDEKGRIDYLGKIACAYEALIFERNNIERIYITTATDVTEAYIDKIVTVFEKKLGKKLAKEHIVDPKIIGGVRVKIGSRLYDDTTYTQLQKVIRQMRKEV